MKDDVTTKHVRFSSDFSSGRTPEGEVIKFTRSEARALSYLAGLPNKVVTRNQLLDAVSEPGSDKNDRSVDFLVNRIRRKLNDDAKDPKIIGSRYGEGYVWLAEWSTFNLDTPQVFLAVGPVRWPPGAPHLEKPTLEFAEAFSSELRDNSLPEQDVVLEPEFNHEKCVASSRPEYTIEIVSVVNGSSRAIIITTKPFDQARLIQAHRFPLGPAESVLDQGTVKLDDFAPTLLAKIWKDKATLHRDVPVQVAMHDVVPSNDKSEISWNEADSRLKTLRAQHPEDPELKIMYAAHLHTKYVMLGPEIFYKGTDNCEQDEKEIERLVLEALPLVEAKPEFCVIAAKLLFFLKSGYDNLAVNLAEGALAQCSHVASTMAVVGQMRAFRGDFLGAVECLDQARALSKRGSEFHVYVLVLLVQVHLAAKNNASVEGVRTELYAIKPSAMLFFEVLLTNPDRPSLRAKAAVMMLSRRRAQAVLKHVFYIAGSIFEQEEHRENMMRTLVILLRRRFGHGIFTDRMRDLLPNLLG